MSASMYSIATYRSLVVFVVGERAGVKATFLLLKATSRAQATHQPRKQWGTSAWLRLASLAIRYVGESKCR